MEVVEARQRGAVVLIPVGTIEGNAPHMPMGYDYLFADAVAERVAERTGSIRLPGIAFGVSELLSAFPGTIYVTPELLQAQVEWILRSLIKHGFEHLLLIGNHIPNQQPIENACRRIRGECGVIAASTYPGMLAKALGGDIFDKPGEMGHGAEPGTSIMQHLTPHAMRMDLLEPHRKVNGIAGFDFASPFAVIHGQADVNFYLDLHDLTHNAQMADPDSASAEKGAQIMDRIVEFTASFVERFRGIDTKAIVGATPDHYPIGNT
ncbi:MAG: creatininase family protein [Actinobacteria bacterium]|nr:creatininase family protein [Actinomycetota bacterium]